MNQLNSTSVNRRGVIALVVVLVLGLTAFMIWLASSGSKSGGEGDYLSQVDDLQVLSQQIARHANEAAASDAKAFDELSVAADRFGNVFGQLSEGAQSSGFPVAVKRVDGELADVQAVWDKMSAQAQTLVSSKGAVLDVAQRAETAAGDLRALQDAYLKSSEVLVINAAPVSQVAQVNQQAWLTERTLSDLQKLVDGKDVEAAAADFSANAAKLVLLHNGMRNGDVAAGISRIRYRGVTQALGDTSTQAQSLGENAEAIAALAEQRAAASAAAAVLVSSAGELQAATGALSDGLDQLFTEQLYARLAVALIILAVIAFIVYRRIDARLKKQSEANANNQEAILRLLDELADLADGDLTVNATVTEDFTGAIADSINYAIDQLRSLVVSINSNSVQVAQAAEETRSTANYLSEASVSQAEAITKATSSINEIVSSMDEVANNADQSSKVAGSSVEIANKGAGAVQNTINGMDKIREQIQKTSKQIKRLGESSQEIGDIISLINDIADQTNILSLNAAIQASMAGDAGRGFAVVADEVQRLAERSGAATKQIEVLVKTIQADTNEAVISMEKTTAEVVQGARLAQDAGVALEEIEEVSNDLAKLIQDISGRAESQSKAAVEISTTMGLIQEITSQTSSGTQDTASSIGNLANLANEMRNSVSGFTLPGDEPSQPAMPDVSAQTASGSGDNPVDAEDEPKGKNEDDQAASAA